MVAIEVKKLTRRNLLFGALALLLPVPELPSKPKFIPFWVEQKFPHLELKKNGPYIEIIVKSFNIDPNILLALLLMESSVNTRRSYAGAEGAYQIMPNTRKELIREIDTTERLSKKRDTLGIKTADLQNPRIFKGQIFLACVYLDKADIPKGPVYTFSEDYPQKLEGIRQAAIRYHDGLYSDVAEPTDYGKLAGERVVGIFELLQGSKSFRELPKGVANFLGMR